MTKARKNLKAVASILLMLVMCSCFISTTYAAKTPTISNTKVTVTAGSSKTIKVNNTNKKVTWKSSNKSIVKITSTSGKNSYKAKIKGIKKGSATITAKVGGKTLKCKVTVKSKPSAKTSTTVYITPTGEKYHSTTGCPTLSRSKTITAISLSSAQSQGYTACKVCH
ncbi:MAG: hypothetical protein ACI4HM_01935 [Ruminococcus sp.]